MDERNTSLMRGALRGGVFSRGRLGALDPSIVETVIAASGDVAMVIDGDGVICDMALSSDELAKAGVDAWLDQRWADTVTLESKHKVDELLRDAQRDGRTQWRELNQVTPVINSLIVRFTAISTSRDGMVIVVGRDDRFQSIMQQRLFETQQSMERDHSRLRDAESRFSALFHQSGEGIVIVELNTKKIIDANPLAEEILSTQRSMMIGELWSKLFDMESQEQAGAMLVAIQSYNAQNVEKKELDFYKNGRLISASASLFRQFSAPHCLIRLKLSDEEISPRVDYNSQSARLIEKMPDAFVVTDDNWKILDLNAAFLDLMRIATKQQAVGQALTKYLGRPGVDKNILMEAFQNQGFVRNFNTTLRNFYDELEDVEVAGAGLLTDGAIRYGLIIRVVRQNTPTSEKSTAVHRHSVEQLSDLVGRVKLKDLVRESADLIESLAIQAALELTNDNRASAAELLGLSRQSLYSKMRRFGLGNLPEGEA